MPSLEWRLLQNEQDRVRSNLRSVAELRRRAQDAAIEATGRLEAAVIDAEEVLGVSEIARLAGVSRQTVYKILADLARVLD